MRQDSMSFIVVAIAALAIVLGCERGPEPDTYGLTRHHYAVIQLAIEHAIAGGALGRDVVAIGTSVSLDQKLFTNRLGARVIPETHQEAYDQLSGEANVRKYVHGLRKRGLKAMNADMVRPEDDFILPKCIRVSAVGFDSRYKTAVIYCRYSSDNLGGCEKILLLSRHGQRWKLDRTIVLSVWMSTAVSNWPLLLTAPGGGEEK